MSFNSYSYLLALIPVVVIYWQLPQRHRMTYVIAASLAFYASWNVAYTPLPIVVCCVAAYCGKKIAGGSKHKTLWLRAGIAFGLLVMAVFKYRDFLLSMVNPLRLFGARPWSFPGLLLPLGISFYVFEAISYLLDTYQGRVTKSRLQDLAAFILFWPHLIAGPIVRFRELIPQFSKQAAFDSALALEGLDRLFLGLVQKNLLANTLGGLIEAGFLPGAELTNSFIDNWFLAVGFGLQIYFDFAAYTNMAIGAALLLGIKLPENFRFPYWAATPPDFWSRWHMTLSRWIRDYLFFPIAAKYSSRPALLYVNLIGTMGLVGLWHGAGWGFIVWGLLHGVYLVLYRVWESFTAERPKLSNAALGKFGWRLFTLVAVIAAWIPFRASSLGQSLVMLKRMFLFRGFILSYNFNSYLIVAMVALYCVVEPWLAGKLSVLRVKPELDSWRRAVCYPYLLRAALYAAGLFLFLIFDDQDRQFIYFQF
ncbi:MAG: MBOAT family O-acyltransferase [Bryobacteraceae bacterium]|jgi:alginate O-acetyltransferase complex protein AlgI